MRTNIQLAEKLANDLLLNSQSMEVKMFIHKDPKESEKSICQWLKQNKVTIHHITQSQSEKGGSFIRLVRILPAG